MLIYLERSKNSRSFLTVQTIGGKEVEHNEFNDVINSIKKYFQRINPNTKLKLGMFLIWIILMWAFLFTEFGRMIISFMSYLIFGASITSIIYWIYLGLREKENTEKDIKDFPNSSFGSNFVIFDDVSEKNDEIIDEKPIYYILDTSAFFAIQEYTSKRNHCVSDLLYGDMTLNDNFKVVYEAIRTRRCYVTEEIVKEIFKLEERGLLQKGISEFIEDDISVWKAPAEMPEHQKMLSRQDIDENKQYKLKHYKLVWNAAELAESVDGEVYIVTSCKKMTSLAEANQVKVVDPMDIEKEE